MARVLAEGTKVWCSGVSLRSCIYSRRDKEPALTVLTFGWDVFQLPANPKSSFVLGACSDRSCYFSESHYK